MTPCPKCERYKEALNRIIYRVEPYTISVAEKDIKIIAEEVLKEEEHQALKDGTGQEE